jgi:hypothetical protein
MIETVAWAGGITGVAFAVASTVKSLYSKKVCSLHDGTILTITSDLASIKSCLMKVTTYVADKATQEGRDLENEIIDLLMKKGDKN